MAIILNRINNTVKNEKGQTEYEDKYLLINCVASRGNTPTVNKFQIRFANGNDLRLVEDFYEEHPLTTQTVEQGISQRISNGINGVERRTRKI
jgi:hypothetical protein